MINEELEEQACLYVLGALEPEEHEAFERALGADAELLNLVRDLSLTVDHLSRSAPEVAPPASLKARILSAIEAPPAAPARPVQMPVGLAFASSADPAGWKALPVPGASIKLLSLQPERGYAVLLGRLDPGVRYPAHTNAGPEDFLILTGDLHVSGRRLAAGDFHHADAGSFHEENFSVEGCTLIAVLTTADPLVAYAMA
jgi:ChrR Cupin-like domain